MFAERQPVDLVLQGSLFGLDDPAVDRTWAGVRRLELSDGAWVDHVPGWLCGGDAVFAALAAELPWRQREVTMYGRRLPEPRLTWWWDADDGQPEPLPVLADARRALSDRYGAAFDSIGANLYRDGRDSVAWHGDRVQHLGPEPLVAVLSVGAPRPFLLRPRGGGSSRGFLAGQGDLLVMGGTCQHTWEHTVPKVARAGPRISVTFRHGGPDPAPD